MLTPKPTSGRLTRGLIVPFRPTSQTSLIVPGAQHAACVLRSSRDVRPHQSTECSGAEQGTAAVSKVTSWGSFGRPCPTSSSRPTTAPVPVQVERVLARKPSTTILPSRYASTRSTHKQLGIKPALSSRPRRPAELPEQSPRGSSMLEQEAVNPRSQREYWVRVNASLDFCTLHQIKVEQDEGTLEAALLEYFDHQFHEGALVDVGTKLIAALVVKWPHFFRCRGPVLARARRAIQGWIRLRPLWSRLQGLVRCRVRHHRYTPA